MTKEAIYNYFYKLGCADAIKYAAPKEEFVGPPEPKGLNSSQIGGMPSLKAKNTLDINRVIPRGVTDAASAVYNRVGPWENQAIPAGFNRSAGAARAANPDLELYNQDKQHSTKGLMFKGTWG